MGMEIEDDVIFADLSKQIALLIMDDEEEFPVQTPPVHVQGFHHMDMPQAAMMPPPYMYENYEMTYRSRESKGTGVFIPRSSVPRRMNRSTGKSSWTNNNSQKQLEKSRVAVSRATNNDRLHSNYYKSSAGSLKNRT